MASKRIRNIQIVISRSKLFESFAPAVCESFASMGCKATLIEEPQQVNSKCDILLFIADYADIRPFIPLIRRLDSRPSIACWYLEQLPPPNMSPAAIKIAQRLACCYWPVIISEILPFARKLINKHDISKPKRNTLTSFFQKALSLRLKKILKTDGYDCKNIDHLDMFKMVNKFQNICEIAVSLPIDYIFTSMVSRSLVLGNAGLETFMIPVGYHPVWGEHLNMERDIDVTFIGHLRRNCGKRGVVLKRVFAELGRRGYNVQIITYDCFGSERTRLMNTTKILLDVVRMPWELPGMRHLIAGSCGAMVVTTGFNGDGSPYISGRHFIEAPADTLLQTLIYYLRNDLQRQKVADQARRMVTQENTLERRLGEMLDIIESHRPGSN